MGQHDISIVSTRGCYQNKYEYGSRVDETVTNVGDGPSLQLDIRFDPGEGCITVTSQIRGKHNTWAYKVGKHNGLMNK